MTAEQIRLVRDLRSFESPVCMEAAREIEKQAAKAASRAEDLAIAEQTIEKLSRRILILEAGEQSA